MAPDETRRRRASSRSRSHARERSRRDKRRRSKSASRSPSRHRHRSSSRRHRSTSRDRSAHRSSRSGRSHRRDRERDRRRDSRSRSASRPRDERKRHRRSRRDSVASPDRRRERRHEQRSSERSPVKNKSTDVKPVETKKDAASAPVDAQAKENQVVNEQVAAASDAVEPMLVDSDAKTPDAALTSLTIEEEDGKTIGQDAVKDVSGSASMVVDEKPVAPAAPTEQQTLSVEKPIQASASINGSAAAAASKPSPPAVDVSSIKLDILKALAEARSTIAGIKSDAAAAVSETQVSASEPQESMEASQPIHQPVVVPARTAEEVAVEKPVPVPSPKKRVLKEPVDEFDMFSMAELEDGAMPTSPRVAPVTLNQATLQSNCDDAEGYYAPTIGETMNDRYRVLGTVGKGVFSTVLRCQCISSPCIDEVVAIKLIRNNDIMREAAQTEIKILHELAARDTRDKKHCVRLLDTFDHRNHVALVFEPMQMNVREAMKKFGGKGGISIQAVRIFCKHLLIALNHLEACGIVHADIKPDNMLLDEKQTTIKLCDFGSAFNVDEGKQDPTPYLVSRFYRAPEIVLGLAYDKAVDMWSVGCCLYEMFTGKVMFPGSTNNEMLKYFMELKGKIPNKLIKKHRQAYIDQFQMDPHFTEDNKFCSRESDRVTGKPVLRLMDAIKTKNDLGNSLMSAKSSTDDRKLVLELRNLLERMFTLDPSKRITVREALAHPFVKT